MGWFHKLLGSDSEPTSKNRNSDITPKEYKQLRDTYADLLKRGTTGNMGELKLDGVPSYDGSFTADLTDNEQTLLDQIMAHVTGRSANMTSADTVLGNTLNGQYMYADSNPYLQSAMQSATGELQSQYENVTVPQLESTFKTAGQNIGPMGSSPFATALAVQNGAYLSSVQKTVTDMAYQNYSQERQNQLNAVNQASALDQQSYEQLTGALQSEALPRLIEQYGIDQGVKEYQGRLTALLQLLGYEGDATTVHSSGGSGAGGGGAEVAGAGIAAVAGIAAAFASDRRLKTDIVPMKVQLRGIPLYEYRYRWDTPDKRRWGVMAQEVPAYARVIMPSGFLGVNYPALVR